MTIDRHIVVVDAETNGFDHYRHQAVEFAWWNLTTGARDSFIPRHNVRDVLIAADIESLRINRYMDRIAGQPQDDGAGILRLWGQFVGGIDLAMEQQQVFPGATLTGANPKFDAPFLKSAFCNDEVTENDPEPWHHRFWDVEAYAAGVLGLSYIPGLTEVCERLDVKKGDHTAMGDVVATGTCLLRLMEKAGAPAWHDLARSALDGGGISGAGRLTVVTDEAADHA